MLGMRVVLERNRTFTVPTMKILPSSLIVRREIPRQSACYREKPLVRKMAVEVKMLLTNEGQARGLSQPTTAKIRLRFCPYVPTTGRLGAPWGRRERKDASSTRDHAVLLKSLSCEEFHDPSHFQQLDLFNTALAFVRAR